MGKIDIEDFVIAVRTGKREDFHEARFKFSFDDKGFLSIEQCEGDDYFPIAAFAKAVLYSDELKFLRDEAEKRELKVRRESYGACAKPYKWGVFIQSKHGSKAKYTLAQYPGCWSETDHQFITAEHICNKTYLMPGLEVDNGVISLYKTGLGGFLDQCRYIHENIKHDETVDVEFDKDIQWINKFLELCPRCPRWNEHGLRRH